mgnify:CR=1 FL=1
MENLDHPEKEDIFRYIAKELPEEQEVTLGEHLAVCLECCSFAQETFKNKLFWDNWTARQHGEAYWKKRIYESITQVQASAATADLKARLENWLNSWREKAGELAGMYLGKLQILVPEHSLHFVYDTVVRGTGEERDYIKVVSKEKPEVQVITDAANKKVIIQIEESRGVPPAVILIPETGAPLLAQPQKVAGTNFYAAYFENLPVGEYTLIFEAQKEKRL